MHFVFAMATTADQYDLHDHSGARWLTPFMLVVLATIVVAFALLLYPYRFGA
jgi:hypothetical protein